MTKRGIARFGPLTILPVIFATLGPAVRAAWADEDPNLPRYTTRFYVIHSDLDRTLVSDLANRMDAMYDEYQRRLARFQTNRGEERLRAFIFRDREAYLGFVGPASRNTAGVFMPRRKCLAAFLGDQGVNTLHRTLQHEAFHQFAHATIGPNMPLWLNEGIAQVFEEGIWTGNGFVLGQVPPHRIRQLHFEMKNRRLIPFETIMSMSHERWNHALAGEEGDGATQYNQTWAMVHFLIHARDSRGKEKFRARLVEMLEHLHSGKDGQEAFETAFSPNVAGFQKLFVEYANNLQPTPEASMMERQSVLAHMLIFFRSKGFKFDTVDELREAAVKGGYYFTAMSSSGVPWKSDPDVENYFCDVRGRLLPGNQLFFDRRRGAPLPDIVCRGSGRVNLRTRFEVGEAGKVVHEVVVE